MRMDGWLDGVRGGGSKGGRGTVCVVAWLRRRREFGERKERRKKCRERCRRWDRGRAEEKEERQMGPCRLSEA